MEVIRHLKDQPIWFFSVDLVDQFFENLVLDYFALPVGMAFSVSLAYQS